MFPMPDGRDGAVMEAWWGEYHHRRFVEQDARTRRAIARARGALAAARLKAAPGRMLSLLGLIMLAAEAKDRA